MFVCVSFRSLKGQVTREEVTLNCGRGRLTRVTSLSGGCLSGVRGNRSVPDLAAFTGLYLGLRAAPSVFLLNAVGAGSVPRDVVSGLGLYGSGSLSLVDSVVRYMLGRRGWGDSGSPPVVCGWVVK